MDKQTQKKLIETVKKNYQSAAQEFSDSRKRKNRSWDGLLEIVKNLKDNSSILDAGCGNGRLLETLKDKKINYLGTDSCQELLELAKKDHPAKEFKQVDVLDLGTISQINFDYVFCIAVLHHLPGRDLRIAAMKQLKNKVSDDGEIIISVWNLWSQKKFRKLIWKFFILKLLKKNKMDFGDILFDWKNPSGEALSQRYYHAFSKRELKKIVRLTGLKIKNFKKDKYNYYLILEKKS